jgi:hypothetical protein
MRAPGFRSGKRPWIGGLPNFGIALARKEIDMHAMSVAKIYTAFLILTLPAFGQGANNLIEPNAGSWKTWVISSAEDFRVPPPPDEAMTRSELEWLRGFVTLDDPQIAGQIQFWDAGAPSYRWVDLISKRFVAGQPLSPLSASRLHVSHHRDLRRHDRGLGVKILLQPATPKRARPRIAHGAPRASESLVPV